MCSLGESLTRCVSFPATFYTHHTAVQQLHGPVWASYVSLQKRFSETPQSLHFPPAFQAAAKFSKAPSPSVAGEFDSEYGLNML